MAGFSPRKVTLESEMIATNDAKTLADKVALVTCWPG